VSGAGLPNQPPWGEAGRELRETQKGLAVAVLRTVSTAVLAVMERRWSSASMMLRIAADVCEAVGRLDDAADLEADVAQARKLQALHGGKPS
jgi:hypothetical protein